MPGGKFGDVSFNLALVGTRRPKGPSRLSHSSSGIRRDLAVVILLTFRRRNSLAPRRSLTKIETIWPALRYRLRPRLRSRLLSQLSARFRLAYSVKEGRFSERLRANAICTQTITFARHKRYIKPIRGAY